MGRKQLPEEFKEFIQCLNNNNVKYLLVGGWAVGIYGQPRATKDIDFLISTKKGNLKNLEKALNEFGAPPINVDGFKEEGYVVRMGSSPTQIDIINKASGIIFDDCYKNRKIINIDKINISIISVNDLISNKKASGRNIDNIDAEKLEEHIKSNNTGNTINSLNLKKYYEIKNEKIEDKIKNIKELDNFTDYETKERKYYEIKKFKFNNGKDIFVLQGVKYLKNNNKISCIWYFEEDFNKNSAMNFILQYNKKNK